MKGAAFWQIINTSVLYLPFLIVQATISPYFIKFDQLQTKATEGIDRIDSSLNQEYTKISNIPTEDDKFNLELSTHLKSIENSLMVDTDDEALEYLNNHQESDTTSLWDHISQEMHTILAPDTTSLWNHNFQEIPTILESYMPHLWSHTSPEMHTICQPEAPETIMKLPTSKRRRKMTKPPTYFTVLESNPITSHENPTLGIDYKESQLDAPVPNSEFQNLQISHKRQKKSKGMLGGIGQDEHAYTTQVYKKPQGSKRVARRKQVENKFSYSQFQGRGILSVLKLKGALALWHNPEVSRQMDKFFETLDKDAYSKIWSSSKTSYSPEHVISTIERVRTDVVIAYFGGLSIVLQSSPNEALMTDMVYSGWLYLQRYLDQEFDLEQTELSKDSTLPNRVDSHHFSRPLNLMKYMLKLEKSGPVQPSLIETLILNWERESIHPPQYNIRFSVDSFLSVILSEAKLRGKKIWTPKLGELNDDTSKPKIEYVSELSARLKQSIASRPAIYLAKIGRSMLEEQMEFSEHAKIFFEGFEKDMQQSLTKCIHFIRQVPETIKHNSMLIDPIRIQDAISAVQSSLMPAFVALLISLHQDQKSNHIKDILLTTGWETLQAYLSKWTTYLPEDPFSIFLFVKGRGKNEYKWYSAKEPIQYFCLCHHMEYFSIEAVWFLYELWYEAMIQGRFILDQDVDFKPSPPNRDISHKIGSLFLKMGLAI
ncbi:hypothetical protein DFH28DRAFT_1057980 [Melampsora americana]|nr:hypothetical protein DFH28DRAFT_1057980 [Melampsora americana]